MNIRHKNARLYIAGGFLLVLAVIVFAQQAFNLTFIQPSRPDQILFVWTLSTLIFLTLLVFGFILLRTVVKVWVERKQGKPGSRFKTRLLVMLVILTLVPAASVFAYAYGLLNRSIDRWFSVQVDQIFLTTRQIEELNIQSQREHLQAALNYLASDLPADLETARRLLNLDALILIDPAGRIEASAAKPSVDANAVAGPALLSLDPGGNGFSNHDARWIAARSIETEAGARILIGALPARQAIAELNAQIQAEKAKYDLLKDEKVVFRETYAAVLALMTILVLFAAVWVGLLISKRVTEPIEALAAATEEISAGNLDYRVRIQGSDELGMLITRFNDMASRLQGTTAELETRRRYIEVILESIPTGVISLDPDLRIHTLNRAARRMFSVQNAAHLEDIFQGEELKEVRSLLDAAAEGNQAANEISFSAPGRPGHSAVAASRLKEGGFVLVVEDLTEFVRAQRASAWRDVARRLAHEIKNPLTPIQLSAERISRNIARLPAASPRVSAVMQECVGAIVDEVASLKHMVDEFVRFARLPTVTRVPESMHELVDRTLALYEGRLEGVSVVVRIPADLPPILMDSTQMRRVLINLIDNALEAMGGVSERALRIACELARDGTMARLTLEDTGVGIAPEDRERLFAPYFSTRKDGTGLGLSIASRIVSDHGGYIGAEQNAPRGTRFVIELPVCPESSLSMTNPVSGSR